MHGCTYNVRPPKIGCKNHMQQHHAIGERHAHHPCTGHYCKHASSIQVPSFLEEDMMGEINGDGAVAW